MRWQLQHSAQDNYNCVRNYASEDVHGTPLRPVSMHSFMAQLPKTINWVTEPYEFHRDETPLSSDETPSFNAPAKSAILLM